MNKLTKFGFATLAIFAFAAGSVALAANGVGQDWSLKTVGNARIGMVASSGEFHARGIEVVATNVTANTITGKYFGFTKEVNIGGAKITGAKAGALTLADVKAGDQLAVWGKYDESSRTFTFQEIRDMSQTQPSKNTAAIQAKINELMAKIRELQAKLTGQH